MEPIDHCVPSQIWRWSAFTNDALCSARIAGGVLSRGRGVQRRATLVPLAGESPQDVVDSLARHGEEINELWTALHSDAWGREIVEPRDNPDLGPIPLGRLPLLRLTEVEVHGTDLGLNLPDWSEIFIDTVLPMRLEWLNVRRTNHREFGRELTGVWLLAASDGPTYKVSVDGTKVESGPALRNARTTAVIEASSRDLLALLLGRPLVTPPVITGDVTFGQSFAHTFPGP